MPDKIKVMRPINGRFTALTNADDFNMGNIELEAGPGDVFSRVAEKAQSLAINKNRDCQFVFNGVTCIVCKDTNLLRLFEDYQNSWTMDWKTVGPDCLEYDHDTQLELDTRLAFKEREKQLQNELSSLKQAETKRRFLQKIKGIEVDVVDTDKYKVWKNKNTDGYGAACVEFAENWAKLMQKEMSHGQTVASVAKETSEQTDFIGLSGFQYGAVISILTNHWKHGAELLKWHQKS